MKIQSNGNTFNDKMVKKTVLPAIYLWLLACAAVVGMGIWKPDVVLQNLDGFIALIAIIGGVAAPATVLRMWESEQVQEVDNIPIQLKHQREMEETLQNHQMEIERLAQSHKHSLETSDQSHSQLMDKVPIKKGKGE